MATIFSRIIAGEIPCYKIYEDELTFAFLDINPYQIGHTLIVPKTEVDHFYDLPEPYYTALFQTAKKLAPAIKQATGSKRVGLIIEGLEVPHVHLKMIPMHKSGDLDPTHAHTESDAEMQRIQQAIISHL